MNELSGIVGGFDRSDTEKRTKLGFADETAIVDWIRASMLPRYDEIDTPFRQSEQRYWIRDQ